MSDIESTISSGPAFHSSNCQMVDSAWNFVRTSRNLSSNWKCLEEYWSLYKKERKKEREREREKAGVTGEGEGGIEGEGEEREEGD